MVSLCPFDHLAVTPKNATYLPHTAGRYQLKRFRKGQCPLVERLTNCLMFHGRNTGKKMNAMKIVEQAFDIINLMTDKNPIQVLVEAVSNAGPREDSNRYFRCGASPGCGCVSLPPCELRSEPDHPGCRLCERTMVADEIINASKGSSNSYAIKKKDEIERVAKANR
ncbi:hypothetical protein BLSTO_00707 [Blastocystis sp. subtype 1]